MGEISRAQDQVFEAIPARIVLTGIEHAAIDKAIAGVYEVGHRHGEADYAEEHRDDEETWVTGARALLHAGGTDQAIGAYVKHFLNVI